MLPLRKDTLEYQLSRPGVVKRDMSAVPAPLVVKTMINNKQDKHHPEIEGLRFYMANHAVMVMRQKFLPKEPMGKHEDVLNSYNKVLAETAPRMFHYLLKICTREMRHTKNHDSLPGLVKQYGPEFFDFYKKIRGTGSSQAVDTLLADPPNMTIGDYVDGLYVMFDQGSFGGGYGGKAWAEVTRCLREFVHGRYSAEMMMDTAFTLCHNNGPIFNKGMEFHGYDHHEIVRILDVQRSGQIPQFIAEGANTYAKNDLVQKEYAEFVGLIGNAFGGYVDWYLVEALGAMGSYQSDKDTQISKHGESKVAAKAMKIAASKKAMYEMESAAKLVEKEKTHYTVAPGLVLKKTHRELA